MSLTRVDEIAERYEEMLAAQRQRITELEQQARDRIACHQREINGWEAAHVALNRENETLKAKVTQLEQRRMETVAMRLQRIIFTELRNQHAVGNDQVAKEFAMRDPTTKRPKP